MAIVKNDYSFCSPPPLSPDPLRNFHFSSPPLFAFYCIWVVEGRTRQRRRSPIIVILPEAAAGWTAMAARRPLLPICERSEEVGSIAVADSIAAAVTNFGHDNYLLTCSRPGKTKSTTAGEGRETIYGDGTGGKKQEGWKSKERNEKPSRTMALRLNGSNRVRESRQ